VSAYRCEIDAQHRLAFVELDHHPTD
jgi:hypothetical protein